MDVKGESFSKRLSEYSNDTILLLMSLNNRNLFLKAIEVISKTDTEKDVVTELLKLKEQMPDDAD